jgi:hypothetical protein
MLMWPRTSRTKHRSAPCGAFDTIHGLNKYIKFHKELIKTAIIFYAKTPQPTLCTMQLTDIKIVVRKEADFEFPRAGPSLQGLGELDTGGLVSVYRVEGSIYKFYGVVNFSVGRFCEPALLACCIRPRGLPSS